LLGPLAAGRIQRCDQVAVELRCAATLDTPKLLAYWDKVNPSKAEQWRKTAQEFDFDNLPNSRNWWKLSDDEIHDFFMWVKNIRADISIDEMIEAQRYHSEQLNKIQ
ncbi:hypothetical protein KC219_21070, partial [Mycobacterium tuberculosis]|nr:hypothetical protein [Mycobacterium tuberculosis]